MQQQLARNRTKQTAKNENVEFNVGDRVIHNIFGEGVVISAQKITNDSMLEIAFDKVGTKKIMANFAKIRKI